MKTNPLPNHNGAKVSVVIEEEGTKSVRGVVDVKTLMIVVMEKLWEHGFLEGIHDDCVICDSDSNCCVEGMCPKFDESRKCAVF